MAEMTKFDCRYYCKDKFIIASQYEYKTASGEYIIVPKNFITDLASIPRIFRIFLNSYGDNYTRAAVIHDYLYSYGYKDRISRKRADSIFLEIMKERGLRKGKRIIMYLAVRIFGVFFYKKGEKDVV